MAQKTKTDKRLTREKIWKIWPAVGAKGWLDILQNALPENGFHFSGSDVVRGSCPRADHDDKDPSFHLNVARGFGKCYGCGYYESNPISLVAIATRQTESEALAFLQEKHGLNFISHKAGNELEAQRKNQEVKKTIYQTSHEAMCMAIADPGDDEYKFAHKAVDWLVNERGLPKDMLHALPLGVLPPAAQLQSMVKNQWAKRHKAWKQNKDGSQQPFDYSTRVGEYLKSYASSEEFRGSILWPLYATPTEIGRLKLRVPTSEKTFFIVQDDFENTLGMLGLNWDLYSDFLDPKNKEAYVYVTEGEMDVLSIMSRFAQNGKADFPIVSAGGTGGAAHIEAILASCGIKRAYFIGDSPTKHGSGDPVVEKWLDNMHDTAVRVFVGWDKLEPHGDLDEAVNGVGLKKLSEIIWKKADKNFIPAWRWAANRAIAELDELDSDDARELYIAAAKHGRYLRDRFESNTYVMEIARRYNLSPTQLKIEVTKREDSETGFIHCCADALREMLYPVATYMEATNRWILLYAKKKKSFCKVKLDSDQSISQELGPITGPLYQFIEDHVGYPAFLESPYTSEHSDLRRLNNSLRYYIKEAILHLSKDMPELSNTETYRQGYHSFKSPYGEHMEYLVCGSDIFKFTRDVDGEPTYRQLEGPTDEGVVFDIGINSKSGPAKPWYPGGLKVADLDRGKNIDIEKLYDKVHAVYDKGFRFKNHKTTASMLTALMLAMPMINAMPRQLLISLIGESGSGKSTVAATFSGIHVPKLQMLYAGHGTSNYSTASVFALTREDSRCFVLDEFEYSEPEKAVLVRRTMAEIRGFIGDGTTRIRATPEGGTISSRHKLTMFFASISSAEKPQDLNRLLVLETDKVEGRDSPANIIERELGYDYIKDVARDLTVAMYPHVTKLVKYYSEFEANFDKMKEDLGVKIEHRYAGALFVSMSIMRLANKDWKSFLRAFVESNQPILERVSSATESEQYIKGILYTAAVPHPEDRNVRRSVAQILFDPVQRDMLNTTACGAYYDPVDDYLVILLEQAIASLLSAGYKTKGVSANRLKDILGRYHSVVPNHIVTSSRVLHRLRKFTGAGVTNRDVVVLHAKEWMDTNPETVITDEITVDPVEPELPKQLAASDTSKPGTKEGAPNARKRRQKDDDTDPGSYDW